MQKIGRTSCLAFYGLYCTTTALSAHFGEASFFRLFSLESSANEICDEQILTNPFLHEEKAKGIKVAEWLLAHDIDVVLTDHDQSGKGPAYVLGNGGVKY